MIVGTLFSSIDFASNIIYPKELEGHKLLEFENDTPKNFWERLSILLGFGRSIIAKLTKEVGRYKNIS